MVSPLNSSIRYVENNAAQLADHLSLTDGATQNSLCTNEKVQELSKDAQVKKVAEQAKVKKELPYAADLENYTILMKKGYASSCERYLPDAIKEFPGKVYVINKEFDEKTCYYKNEKDEVGFFIYNQYIDSDLSMQMLYKIIAVESDPTYRKVKLLFTY